MYMLEFFLNKILVIEKIWKYIDCVLCEEVWLMECLVFWNVIVVVLNCRGNWFKFYILGSVVGGFFSFYKSFYNFLGFFDFWIVFNCLLVVVEDFGWKLYFFGKCDI